MAVVKERTDADAIALVNSASNLSLFDDPVTLRTLAQIQFEAKLSYNGNNVNIESTSIIDPADSSAVIRQKIIDGFIRAAFDVYGVTLNPNRLILPSYTTGLSTPASETRTDTFTTTAEGATVDTSLRPLSAFSLTVKGIGGVAVSWDIRLDGAVSIGNTTATPLGPGESFVGAFEDIKDVAFKTITVFADQDGVMKFQWSTNGVDIDFEESTGLRANIGRGFAITPRAGHFRIVVVNGPVAQVVLRLATIYHSSGTGLITRPLSKNLSEDNFAQTVRAVLCAKKADGTFVNLRATDDGRLLVKVEGSP